MSILDALFGKKRLNNSYYPSDYHYHYDEERKKSEAHSPTFEDKTQPSSMKPLTQTSQVSSNSKAHGISNPNLDMPCDPEDTAFKAWKNDQAACQPNGMKPLVDKANIPAIPNIPTRPNIEQFAPEKPGLPKTPSPLGGAGGKTAPYDVEFGKRPRSWQTFTPRIPEKEVFAFVLENSTETLKHKERIINIITQTVEKKKDAIFLFVKVGSDKKPFIPMDYTTVIEKNIISSLITESTDIEVPNLASALFYLVNNLNVFSSNTFSFGKVKYKLGNCSIVCIGTGACVQSEESLKIISSCISKLQNVSKLKAFKYFCIKDSDAIRVSALGFPVIGHIISDFYE